MAESRCGRGSTAGGEPAHYISQAFTARPLAPTVVGITAAVKYSGLDRMADDVVYRPFGPGAERPRRIGSMEYGVGCGSTLRR